MGWSVAPGWSLISTLMSWWWLPYFSPTVMENVHCQLSVTAREVMYPSCTLGARVFNVQLLMWETVFTDFYGCFCCVGFYSQDQYIRVRAGRKEGGSWRMFPTFLIHRNLIKCSGNLLKNEIWIAAKRQKWNEKTEVKLTYYRFMSMGVFPLFFSFLFSDD